jgi:hypothetical protein
VSADGSRLWSSLLKNDVAFIMSYSEDDHGASWTAMDAVLTPSGTGTPDGLNPRQKPGGQGSIHFALLADPSNKDNVWVGGKESSVGPFFLSPKVVCCISVVLTLFDQSLLL